MLCSCPECGTRAPLGAFFVEDDGKRLALTVADLPQGLGRAVLNYLGLFKPQRTSLPLARAAKLAADVAELATSGKVRPGPPGTLLRAAAPALWAAGIEQLLAKRDQLVLPLESHQLLLDTVYGLADAGATALDAQRSNQPAIGKHLTMGGKSGITPSPNHESPLQQKLSWIDHMVRMGQFTDAEAQAERTAAQAKHGSPNEPAEQPQPG